MTTLLDKAYQKALQRPEPEQNVFASRWLEELESESQWESQFANSEGALADLAKEALAEDDAGKTQPLNTERM